jgi:hypothetical protein
LDGILTITHKALMASAKRKFGWLKIKGKWGANLPGDEKIVAMTAEINTLKGQLKLDPKLSAIIKNGKEKGNKGDKGEKGKKWKNKKNTSNKKDQKKGKVWKRAPPKDGKKKTQEVGKFTFNWCEHHMAWTAHKPSNCELGKQHKADQKKGNNNKANFAVIDSVAATLNSCCLALLTTLANMGKEE